MRRMTRRMCAMELSNGTTLEVTPEHRFFSNGEWTPIEELNVNDTLQLKDNSIVVIENKIIFPTFVEVYNLEIEDNENYYVTEEGVLVHNGYADTNELKKIEERGFHDVNATKNGGLDYADSDALYPIKEGQKNIISIEYSGVYSTDFENASLSALGQKSTPKGYVWHHLDDYDPKTNRGTVQLVKQEAHSGISHIGGCSQYKQATGKSYIFKTW